MAVIVVAFDLPKTSFTGSFNSVFSPIMKISRGLERFVGDWVNNLGVSFDRGDVIRVYKIDMWDLSFAEDGRSSYSVYIGVLNGEDKWFHDDFGFLGATSDFDSYVLGESKIKPTIVRLTIDGLGFHDYKEIKIMYEKYEVMTYGEFMDEYGADLYY